MRVAITAIKLHSGADVYFQELHRALSVLPGVDCSLTWLPARMRLTPWLLRTVRLPAADLCITDADYGVFLKRPECQLWVVLHHCVFEPAYQPFTTLPQKLFHAGVLRQHTARSLAAADQAFAVSEATKRSAEQLLGTQPLTVLPPAVDTEFFQPDPGYKAQSAPPYRLLFSGNLIRRKGIDLLPRILDHLGNEYELHVAAGLRSVRLPDYLKHDRIRILGSLPREAYRRALQQSDIFLFPSRLEGFGYAVAEAMACGKPCVCTQSSALPELVVHGRNGLLCEPENVADFAAAVEQLAKQPALRTAMGQDNVAHIRRHYTAQQCAERLRDFLPVSVPS